MDFLRATTGNEISSLFLVFKSFTKLPGVLPASA